MVSSLAITFALLLSSTHVVSAQSSLSCSVSTTVPSTCVEGSYFVQNGNYFQVSCGRQITGGSQIRQSSANSFQACVNLCLAEPTCVAATHLGLANLCTIYSGSPAFGSSNSIYNAILELGENPCAASTTTTSTTTTSTTTTSTTTTSTTTTSEATTTTTADATTTEVPTTTATTTTTTTTVTSSSVQTPCINTDICGVAGVLETPGEMLFSLTGGQIYTPQQCAALCETTDSCVSFLIHNTYSPDTFICKLYGASLVDSGFTASDTSLDILYDIGCFDSGKPKCSATSTFTTTTPAATTTTSEVPTTTTTESTTTTTSEATTTMTDVSKSTTQDTTTSSTSSASSSTSDAVSTTSSQDPASTTVSATSYSTDSGFTTTQSQVTTASSTSSSVTETSSTNTGTTTTSQSLANGSIAIQATPLDLKKSTVYATLTYTISSCAPTVTNCPYGSVTTETRALYTTVCPVTNAQTYSQPSSTISTVYTTLIYTISSCASTITNCPYGSVTTETRSLYTTICPVSNNPAQHTLSVAIDSSKLVLSSKPAVSIANSSLTTQTKVLLVPGSPLRPSTLTAPLTSGSGLYINQTYATGKTSGLQTGSQPSSTALVISSTLTPSISNNAAKQDIIMGAMAGVVSLVIMSFL